MDWTAHAPLQPHSMHASAREAFRGVQQEALAPLDQIGVQGKQYRDRLTPALY